MTHIKKLEQSTLEKLSKIFGDTEHGLTGSEIFHTLANNNIADIEPKTSKRHRLQAALHSQQEQDGCAEKILEYVEQLMDPRKYIQKTQVFHNRLQTINKLMSFEGLKMEDDGKFSARLSKAKTISEALIQAEQLDKKLIERNIHDDILKYCQEQLKENNYFHAVLEAAKSIAEKIRTKTGLDKDGSKLIEDAFTIKDGKAKLAINSLQTETERTEQKGFTFLLKGLFMMFRNTTSHAPQIEWAIKESDLLDILNLASLIHRKLDETDEN